MRGDDVVWQLWGGWVGSDLASPFGPGLESRIDGGDFSMHGANVHKPKPWKVSGVG